MLHLLIGAVLFACFGWSGVIVFIIFMLLFTCLS